MSLESRLSMTGGLGLALILGSALASEAALSAPARPRILGLAQAAYYVHDLGASRKFYCDFLGFSEALTLSKTDGTVRAALIKIGDRQSVELVPEFAPEIDRYVHIALETDDAEAMRRYLKSCGVAVPDHVSKSEVAAFEFAVKDPDGPVLEFFQFPPGGWAIRDSGRHLPDTRVADHMSHAGITVRHFEAARHFYGDILGCVEIWQGSADERHLNWVDFRVPEGPDWVEFMLHDKPPDRKRLRIDHHFCLAVTDAAKVGRVLLSRPLPKGAVFVGLEVGKDNKRKVQTYDPDGTRIEYLEIDTVDGRPETWSHAPPPPN